MELDITVFHTMDVEQKSLRLKEIMFNGQETAYLYAHTQWPVTFTFTITHHNITNYDKTRELITDIRSLVLLCYVL